jgi:hypothetical protein
LINLHMTVAHFIAKTILISSTSKNRFVPKSNRLYFIHP